MDFITRYLDEARRILETWTPGPSRHSSPARGLARRGRPPVFIGVGGGAGNASHAVNDFRKIAGIESYAPTDNVSELTARINDDGWDSSFANWLAVSRLTAE